MSRPRYRSTCICAVQPVDTNLQLSISAQAFAWSVQRRRRYGDWIGATVTRPGLIFERPPLPTRRNLGPLGPTDCLRPLSLNRVQLESAVGTAAPGRAGVACDQRGRSDPASCDEPAGSQAPQRSRPLLRLNRLRARRRSSRDSARDRPRTGVRLRLPDGA